MQFRNLRRLYKKTLDWMIDKVSGKTYMAALREKLSRDKNGESGAQRT